MQIIRLVLFAIIILVLAALPAGAEVLIAIDKSAQQMRVRVDGALRWTWPVSTGRRGYDTPSGTYTAFRMEEDHYSEEWDDAPMPHSIFFTKRGHAIHGSYETRRIGTPVSHGCVRLHPANAAKLYAAGRANGCHEYQGSRHQRRRLA
jgi:lipoprotein-anchoring transpeptidase ErfK/SrfK